MRVRILSIGKASTIYALADVIHNYINDVSRFDCSVDVKSNGIEVRNIRLKESKLYCGSHPAECENTLIKPRKGKFLEGADWVEFNDTLNDVLDMWQVSANVKSMICIIRKDTRRRTHYGMHAESNLGGRVFNEWNLDESDEHYADYIGKSAPASTYPEGTPGLYERVS
jgi:hypothetical protein